MSVGRLIGLALVPSTCVNCCSASACRWN